MSDKLPPGQSSSSVGGTPGQSGNVLTVVITGTIKGLQSAYTQAAAATKKFTEGVSHSLEGLEKPADKVKDVFKEWAAPVLAASVAFLGFHEVMQAFDKAQALQKTAENLGMTTTELQKLEQAAVAMGGSAEGMDTALEQMSRSIGQSADDSSAAAKSLAKLGLTADSFKGMHPEQAFKLISDKLHALPDAGQRASEAMILFGRGARDMSGFLSEGAEAIGKMGDEASKHGKIVSEEDIQVIVNGKKAITEMAETVENLAMRFAAKLAPAINYIADAIGLSSGNLEDFDSTFNAVAKGIITGVDLIKAAWNSIVVVWDVLKMALIKVEIDTLRSLDDIAGAIGLVGGTWSDVWEQVKLSFGVTVASLEYAWTWLGSEFIKGIATMSSGVTGLFAKLGKGIQGIPGLNMIGGMMETAGNSLTKGADAVAKGETDAIAAAAKKLSDAKIALSKQRDDSQMDQGPSLFGGMADDAQDEFDAVNKHAQDAAKKAADSWGDAFEDIVGTDSNATNAIKDAHDKAAKDVAASAAAGAAGYAGATDKIEEYMKGMGERSKEYAFGLWKGMEDASEKIINIQANQDAANKASMAGQLASYDEFLAMKESRTAEYHLSLQKQAKQAQEALENAQSQSADDTAARQDIYNADRATKELKTAQQVTEGWNNGYAEREEFAHDILTSIAALSNGKSREMFEVAKQASAANALVSTFEGANKALAAFPPPYNFIAAAAVTAAGLANVAKIESSQFGGKGKGGAGGGSAAAPTAPQGRQVNVQMFGDNFSGASVRGLIGAINEHASDNMNLKAQSAAE